MRCSNGSGGTIFRRIRCGCLCAATRRSCRDSRFFEKLHRRAARLKRTRVVFPGYVTGERKRAFLALADLYVFPSRHESYGLTLMEALAAGLPAVCLDTTGARSVMREEFGALVPESGLRAAIARLLTR